MKYNFITMQGEIIETDNLSTIKKGLTWEKLNHLITKYQPNKEEWEFINKYKHSPSVWNFGVLQHLKMIYLFESDYMRLKGGII